MFHTVCESPYALSAEMINNVQTSNIYICSSAMQNAESVLLYVCIGRELDKQNYCKVERQTYRRVVHLFEAFFFFLFFWTLNLHFLKPTDNPNACICNTDHQCRRYFP